MDTQKSHCGQCSRVITTRHRLIRCSDCRVEFHRKCSNISNTDNNINEDNWLCADCAAPCGQCNTLIVNNTKAIQCDSCSLWFHIECGKVSETYYDSLGDSSFQWKCSDCTDLLEISDSDSGDNSQSGDDMAQNLPVSTAKPKSSEKKTVKTKIKLLQLNFQSISNKTAELEMVIDQYDPDIIQGTETWLNESISTSEIFPDGYIVYRLDRNKDGHGGVLLAHKPDIIVTERRDLSTGDSEIMWHQLELQKRRSVIIGTVYKPKHDDVKTLIDLDLDLRKIQSILPYSDIIIGGDFNQPNIDWSTSDTIPNHWACTKTAQALINISAEFGLDQLVHEPTRQQNILDLILTNNQTVFDAVSVEPGISDHSIVTTSVSLQPKYKKRAKRKIFVRRKADLEGIKEHMQNFKNHYFERLSDGSVQDKWNGIQKALTDAMDKHVPTKYSSNRRNVPWFTRTHRRLCRKKQRLYNKAKNSGKEEDWKAFQSFRRQTKAALNKARRDYVSDHLEEQLKSNPKCLWTYIKKIKKEDTGIADLHVNNRNIRDAKGKAEALGDQFASVFTREDKSHIPEPEGKNLPLIPRLTIYEKGVLKLIQNLNPNKAQGPDNVPPWMLQQCADEVAPVLTDLFQNSIDQGQLPEQWRKANICALYKKGDKTQPENYRPVSLTSVVCKMLEHIVHSHIMKHFEANNLLVDSQHGFRAKRSTETQLIQTVHDLALNLENDDTTHMAVLDFSKAFDKVPHERLLNKLRHYGIHGNLLAWTRHFLTSRTQQVVCDGETSTPQKVISGVPQGTVLGPLLFLAYINDLPNKIRSSVRLFADDCVVYASGKDQEHIKTLQQDLYQLEKWQNKWEMAFNAKKCYIMCFSSKKDSPSGSFTFCKQTLQQVDSQPYLGVHLDHNLHWGYHIHQITAKANRVLGFLRRNLWYCTKVIRETAYKTLVQPILEYASCVWDPYLAKDINKTEATQRRAARFCTNKYNRDTSVTTLLQELQWESLQERREKARLVMMYKIINHLVEIDKTKYISLANCSSTRNSHPHKLQRTVTRKTVYQNSFFPRTITPWNNLPVDTALAPTLAIFKSRLNN